MKEFNAEEARELASKATGVSLEERSGYFAKMVGELRASATGGCDSIIYNDASGFTVEMVCELSSRGFVVSWIPDEDESEPDGIKISWKAQ